MSKRIPSSPGERDLTAKAIEAREEAEKNGSRPPPNRRTEEGGKTAAGGEYLQLSLFQRTEATRVAELPAHAGWRTATSIAAPGLSRLIHSARSAAGFPPQSRIPETLTDPSKFHCELQVMEPRWRERVLSLRMRP
jgi:hypothetical protein